MAVASFPKQQPLYKYGETVEVLRAKPMSSADDPFSNGREIETDPELDWTDPDVIERWDRVPLAMVENVELETAATPLATESTLTAYLPYETKVTFLDRVRVVTGPFAGTYHVEGRPAYWRNPYHGKAYGCAVRLNDRQGG